jgi:hypothetical protein
MNNTSALLVLDVQRQPAKGKDKEKILENKLPSTLFRSVFVANFRLITELHYLQHYLYRVLLSDSPMCPLRATPKKWPLTASKDVSLTNVMDSVNYWGKLQKLSKLYWTARNKMGVISLTGVGQKEH